MIVDKNNWTVVTASNVEVGDTVWIKAANGWYEQASVINVEKFLQGCLNSHFFEYITIDPNKVIQERGRCAIRNRGPVEKEEYTKERAFFYHPPKKDKNMHFSKILKTSPFYSPSRT